ncbi:diguanylate cyclase (GGDEF)-like protein [Geothermobacter ehrlichii]|uniref:Diguanylate cyclase (GGDEF)-like protein n=1 Tax=Geothermobacter ehrlichii TaxID=213224 RepID=A0A5D3WMU1_9BACT|nr:GGDEF domain-containing response regulator [Geothermobacter ehrlichii]TYO98900.1 diguanylate cyclase (GGDEF)-like protein [Geothermobacter ehrlichii]
MGEQLLSILIIDDDEDDVLIARDLLGDIVGTSYRVDWSYDYQEALGKLLSNEADACLLDYRLGSRTGLELLREAVAGGCEIPIIFLTGQSDREIDLEAMEAGASDYLVKSQLNAPLLERSIRYAIERARSERRLAHLAQYDHLTGLPNRSLLQDRLSQSLALAMRQKQSLAVLFLDLDRFKIINDTLGHSAGDTLLKSVAERLSYCLDMNETGLAQGGGYLREIADRLSNNLRRSDTVARLGGDEFVVVLSSIAREEDAALVARRILGEIRRPIRLGDREIYMTASIGISLAPTDGTSVEDLIRHADVAMYQAKEHGGNTYQFFSKEMNERALDRLNFESRLLRGLENREFHLHYQPKFSVRTGQISGMEALLRWTPEDGPPVSPAKFIPILEEIGMIETVGTWVLSQACRDLHAWMASGCPAIPVAVNISGAQMKKKDFVDTVAGVLRETLIEPELLELELTESILMHNVDETVRTLKQLTRLGVSVSIDDFGTGYSSLSYLKNFPVKKLKIDSSFIRNIGKDKGDEAIAKSIVDLAKHLGMSVVAEGIETLEQLDFVRRLQCEEAQGFHLGKPAPLEQLLSICREVKDSRSG